MDRVDQPTSGHGEAEAIAEQMHDATEGEPALFIQDHRERHGLRAQLHGRGAQRIRGLQRVPALHAAVTLAALTDGDAKLVHDRALHRQIFLVLRDDAAAPDRSATVGTLRRQRRVMPHIDVRRRTPMALRPYAAPDFRPGRSGCSFGSPRENGAA